VSALAAKAEEGDGMIVDIETFPPSDLCDSVRFETKVQFDDAMALCARQVMVVMIAFTKTEGVSTVCKLDPVKHFHPNELIDRAIDSCPPDARVSAAQLLKQFFRRKRGTGVSEAN
jgi:hypothetical protein